MNDERQTVIADVQLACKGVLERFPRKYYLERARQNGDIPEMWDAMAQQGLLGLGVPEEYGGSGDSLVAQAAFHETMSAAGTPQIFVLATSFVRSAMLAAATPEQKKKYIPPTVTGEKRFCFALTEADAGTNSFNIKTRATRESDGSYRLNGQKVFISHLDHCDHVMVAAKVAQESGSDEIGFFIVDNHAPGLSYTRLPITMYTPDSRFQVFLDNVVVPAENRVGRDGDGKKLLFSALNPERLLLAANVLGLGSHVLAKGVEYARTRAPFGAPIGSYQAIAHPFARAHMHLSAARAMIYESAARYEVDRNLVGNANIAKYLAAEAANEALDACIQAHGGSAFDESSDVVFFWPMIRVQRIAPLNDEMILNHVAERELGLPRSY